MKPVVVIFYLVILITQDAFPTKVDKTDVGYGKRANTYQFPYVASLQIMKKLLGATEYFHVCSGAIVSNSWVLTSASCHFLLRRDFRVAVGILSSRAVGTHGAQYRNVTRIVEHPFWIGGNGLTSFDVSLIKLGFPLIWTKSVKPVLLPDSKQQHFGTAVVVGWNSANLSNKNFLKYAVVEIIDSIECHYGIVHAVGLVSTPKLSNDMLCTKGNYDSTACIVDSGSPLIRHGVLVGIASWISDSCPRKKAPFVFIKVRSVLDWIMTELKTP
ncbi:trypsin-7-like [Agrilus planipennis]|uniref:Trypsin-7-like n=1 Tax=Agrilus planipennis TaxID=224129 RepID=A0A1W4XLD6_AGRPL|nr:trypsin-7-like [Agrilus planipennis]